MKTALHHRQYLKYIDEQYKAEKLTEILTDVCNIIGAQTLNIACQNYEPQGASVTILVSEKENAVADAFAQSDKPGPLPKSVVRHLDKSHICIHTYPEHQPTNGISTFRADIEVSTCGVISPLKALNFLIHSFKSDIVTLDYRVRGFTRDVNGEKHFIDHKIAPIQNFLPSQTCDIYQLLDLNIYQENLFHTKMMLKNFELSRYVFGNEINDLSTNEKSAITKQLKAEIQDIFYGKNQIKE